VAEAKRTFAEEISGTEYAPLLPAEQRPPVDLNRAMMEKFRPLGACLGNGPSGWFEAVHELGGLISHDLTLLRWRA
jgi:hypothetical protein